MACSINFSMALILTEILSTVPLEFLKQMISLESFNSMLYVKRQVSVIAKRLSVELFSMF